jgi:probable rRNA maturation factor
VLIEEKVKFQVELSVTFLDDAQMQELNKEYRNVDLPTDVLSFPLGEDGVYEKNLETGYAMLGDVAVSLEMAKAHAEMYAHSFEREVGFLVVHGGLHLLGYDHEKGQLDAMVMRKKEEEIMTKVGLAVHEISARGKFFRA